MFKNFYFLFLAILALSQKFEVTQYTQHRLYSRNTFILQMSQIPERSKHANLFVIRQNIYM